MSRTIQILEQPVTDIYYGANGHIVIKQADYMEEIENVIILNKSVVPDLIKALTNLLETYDNYSFNVEENTTEKLREKE